MAVRPLLVPDFRLDTKAAVIDLERQIAAAERLGGDEIAARQLAALVPLARHFAQQSPRFARRLAEAGLEADDLGQPGGLARLPPARRQWMQQGEGLHAARIPREQSPAHSMRTSGSTGEPVEIWRSHGSQLVWLANILREHRWRGTDFSVPLASIRANTLEELHGQTWGAPATFVAQTGPAMALPIRLDARVIHAKLQAFQPGNVLIYPTTLAALLNVIEAQGTCLAEGAAIRTIGETVSPALRERTLAITGAHIGDTYSSAELGHIAVQCPVSQAYHCAVESVLVEVLNGEGEPCAPGEAGELVVTDLTNWASPIIRYAIGDAAEVAAPCLCGRQALALRCILGRERNMIEMPDGSRFWPLMRMTRPDLPTQVRQFQLVQQSREVIEVRLAVSAPVTPSQQAALAQRIRQALGHPFVIEFSWFDGHLPPSHSGKFEEFVRNF